MTQCNDCSQEMREADSCSQNALIFEREGKLPLVYMRNSTYFDDNERCHDCGIVNKPGNVHHAGCDMERCPLCGCQLISCGCCADNIPVTVVFMPVHALGVGT